MKNILYAVLVFLLTATTAHAQFDDENIQLAKNAIGLHNCDDALRFLGNVSVGGRFTAPYFLCMAQAHDCKQNAEQAIYYYNKFLAYQPANDSVKKRVAELSDQKTQQARTANEERVARESYQAASKGKKSPKGKHGKKPHFNIDDSYTLYGLSYVMGTGGDNAPYKSGLNINYDINAPIAKNKILLDFTINSSFLFSPNKDWFARAFGVMPSQVSGVGLGLSEDLSFSPMAVVLNKKKVALTVGPVAGIKYIYTPDLTYEYNSYNSNSGSFTSGSIFTFCYGIKSLLLIGDNLAFTAEYSRCTANSVSTSDYGLGSITTPVNHDVFRIGISYRYVSWW